VLPDGDAFKLGLRSDAVKLSRDAASAGFAGQVVYTEYLGDNAYVYVRLIDGTLLAARTGPDDLYEPDTAVTVTVLPGSAHLFSATDGRRI
jgi:lactose/L-arabinose transport system ATP-binding protein